MDIEKALATQLANIEKRTGRSLEQLAEAIRSSGLTRHGELVAMLKSTFGMGHGDANTLVHHVKKSDGASAAAARGTSADDVVAGLYTGPKAALRPIHDRIMEQVRAFGPFEEAPKKTYISLRRKKQFAMVGPATNSRVEVGLNVKNLDGGERLKELGPGRMCSYTVRLGSVAEVDDELIGWLRAAYDTAG